MESCAGCGFDLEGTEKFCPSCGNSVPADNSLDEIILDIALPILLRYEEAIKTNVENPGVLKVSGANLDFYPYYVIEYKIDIERNDPSGKKHDLQNQEIVIIDAVNGELLLSDKKRTKFANKLNPFHSKNDVDVILGGVVERNQIIYDLENIEPVRNNKLQLTGDYAINVIDSKVSLVAVEKVVLKHIISKNTMEIHYKKKKAKGKTEDRKMQIIPRRHEVEILIKSLVYVPMWVIDMKAGDFNYKRKALAASSTILIDEITSCPKHSSIARVWKKPKQTAALCETCGRAFCNDHIFRINQTYYCKEHLPNTPL